MPLALTYTESRLLPKGSEKEAGKRIAETFLEHGWPSDEQQAIERSYIQELVL